MYDQVHRDQKFGRERVNHSGNETTTKVGHDEMRLVKRVNPHGNRTTTSTFGRPLTCLWPAAELANNVLAKTAGTPRFHALTRFIVVNNATASSKPADLLFRLYTIYCIYI